ncbi:hypothetical protein POSPLADRAFT_1062084 [Postia placenta MAD-698-R-SB12]|uniref:Uncharacterized protein n=1 Tax=Postia placenta MAD-698-R-SB12 TaxID=670580 RepID=A0A1X6MKU2_9APHY|nr:hypothetical protein POSPLADRAFT_1062084 [Postia placenta MAD-698-R-SB12]OSX56928.1 hypothetical protein POSPLADRAFT_1062084 [Postia placenta MAD-698-R-SB12]
MRLDSAIATAPSMRRQPRPASVLEIFHRFQQKPPERARAQQAPVPLLHASATSEDSATPTPDATPDAHAVAVAAALRMQRALALAAARSGKKEATDGTAGLGEKEDLRERASRTRARGRSGQWRPSNAQGIPCQPRLVRPCAARLLLRAYFLRIPHSISSSPFALLTPPDVSTPPYQPQAQYPCLPHPVLVHPLPRLHGHPPDAGATVRRDLVSPASPSRPSVRYAAGDTRWEDGRASAHPSRWVASRTPDALLG